MRRIASLALALAAACSPKPLGTGAPAQVTCSTCHGSEQNAAPPKSVDGDTATSAMAVGAHQSHVNDSALRQALSCSDCHPVPTAVDSPGHNDGKIDFTFSALATHNDALAPAFDPASGTCASTWCHGTKLSGGSNTTPIWNSVGAGQAACGTCHGAPPPAPHPQQQDCHQCHPGTVRADGTIDVAGGMHIDGVVEQTSYHPEGWSDPGQHGAQALAGLSACEACHGADLSGGSAGVSCEQCHSGWKGNCTFCHGGVDNKSGAPPKDTHGQTAASEVTVGAHTAHLSDGAMRKAIACSDCHVVPADALSAGHIDQPTATLTFGALAASGGLAPSWDRTGATCASVYCHGASLAGGSHTEPVWTNGASEATCGTCHGLPPPAPHPSDSNCNLCHPGTVNADGSLNVAGGLHIDGTVEVSDVHPAGWADPSQHGPAALAGLSACEACHGADLSGGSAGVSCDQCHSGWKTNCTFCHGGTDSQTGAPPVDTHGKAATTETTVGAHTAHLADSAIRKAIACSDCHVVPADALASGHIDGPTATLTFSALAMTSGASPAWDRTRQTCSGVYCHGATLSGGSNNAPTWTVVDGSQAACGSCHGLPPAAPHPAQTNCNQCHPATVNADGTINVAGGTHIDGQLQVVGYHPAGWSNPTQHGTAALGGLAACEACHGADLSGGLVGVSCEQCHGGWKTNCTFCHGGVDNQTGAPPMDVQGQTATTTLTVGAHTSHLNMTGALASAVACDECHTVPADALSAGHIDQSVTVAFGTLAKTAGASPSWSSASAQCASVYCHGATLGAGTNTTPQWTTVDGTQDACGTCHGLPPTGTFSNNFPNGTFSHQDGDHATYRCGKCHPDASTTSNTIITPAQHINGQADINAIASGCACHNL